MKRVPVVPNYRFPITGNREPVVVPGSGTGGNREPIIFISSRDEVEVPSVRGAKALVEQARTAGWIVAITYAAAFIPDQFHANGNPAKPAHWLRSVVVRLSNAAALGWAVWHAEGGGRWSFVHAFVNCARFGWRRGAGLPSILERINA